MKQLNPYLTFGGTCREALAHYKESLGGEILSLQTFGESPSGVPPEFSNHVMHAEFRAGEMYFMASDGGPNHNAVSGNSITLSLNFDSLTEQETVFARLSAGGKITMPLQDTFWGAKFGMFTDKYGINWMLNCDVQS